MQVKHYKHIVLGAGISGLSLTLELQKRGEDVAILERDGQPGGVLQSIRKGGFTWDRAAHTIAVDQELYGILSRFKLEDLLVKPAAVAKVRQIAINGKIWEISNHPRKILGARFLSLKAKFTLIRELIKKPIQIKNPTVYEFFHYHFGREISRNIISAVFAGIYAGDIEKMEMKSVMAKVYEIEQESGSLIRGLIKNKDKFAGREIYGIKGGMDALGLKLAEQIKEVHFDNAVREVLKIRGGFQVKTQGTLFTCESLISTLPSYALAPLIALVSKELSQNLGKILYEPMVLIHAGFAETDPNVSTAAFGFLCSQYDSPVLKGALFNSDLFEDRAARGTKAYTIFMKPQQGCLDDQVKLDEEVRSTVGRFKKLTQIENDPIVLEKSVWDKAIPQFNKPYAELKTSLLEGSTKIEGFTLSGSFMSGVSVPDCIKYSIRLAEELSTKSN